MEFISRFHIKNFPGLLVRILEVSYDYSYGCVFSAVTDRPHLACPYCGSTQDNLEGRFVDLGLRMALVPHKSHGFMNSVGTDGFYLCGTGLESHDREMHASVALTQLVSAVFDLLKWKSMTADEAANCVGCECGERAVIRVGGELRCGKCIYWMPNVQEYFHGSSRYPFLDAVHAICGKIWDRKKVRDVVTGMDRVKQYGTRGGAEFLDSATGHMKQYAITADEHMRIVCGEVAEVYLRELANARRVPIDVIRAELLANAERIPVTRELDHNVGHRDVHVTPWRTTVYDEE